MDLSAWQGSDITRFQGVRSGGSARYVPGVSSIAGGRQPCRYAWTWYLSGLITYGGSRTFHAVAGEAALEWMREV